ncbi:glycosyltransferase [Spirochaeta cellobiosiphila]|uniref:glycosyltransferase n=1 Tax=Spirochaeta cellobiosiphila TaxID=504483 RepID=UPI00042948BA|nr:glycosyltransferase [Spirochaeta cellobiosiphila]
MFEIIICTYNGKHNLVKVIPSILNQNKFDELVMSIFIVDNNSDIETKQIIKKYEKSCNKIKYLLEEKQGLSFARLKGVQNTTANWLIFIDDDNVLEQNWLINADNFIKTNNNMGAFNGAIIPEIKSKLDNYENIRLKVAYKALACTHLSKSEINFANTKHPIDSPIGAGLVILGNEMRELSSKGWLKNIGRQGEKLSSGEDKEMVDYIIFKGFDVGYTPHCLIYHLITNNRLKEEYLIILHESFKRYKVISLRGIKDFLKNVLFSLCLLRKDLDYESIFRLRIGAITTANALRILFKGRKIE